VSLDDAIRHHLNVFDSDRNYDPVRAGIDQDLTYLLGPVETVLASVDTIVATPIYLSQHEFRDLVAFVRNGLQDKRASKAKLCKLIPDAVPSGRPLLDFEGCAAGSD